MNPRPLLPLLPLLLALLLHAEARADNWRARIYEYGAPSHVVGVDKKKRAFNFFEKKSPLKIRYSYPCVTGQIPGDKQRMNDLRTPEGIYFVDYKIAGGLDFREYGGVAYTLNYPNPVDRLRGKTGHGIWIHSKGFDLTPTKGCVAIGLKDIAEVGPLLAPGTPVVLAEELADVASKDGGALEKLRGLMSGWSSAWSAKSPKLFDFYDEDAYARSTEDFGAFRANKERLFKILTFIKIYNREIHALEGPGYWVTWAEQLYTASNLSTEGIRRLYWQKNAQDEFRIVGMEWIPRNVGMAAAFQKGALVAEGPARIATDAASEAPVAPRLDMPELAPQPEAKPAPAQETLAVATIEAPAPKAAPSEPDEILWGAGKRFGEPQPDTEKAQRRPTPALQLPAAPAQADRPRAQQPPSGQRDASGDATLRAEAARVAREWQHALQNREAGIDAFYDAVDYNKLPAASGVPRGRSLAATLQAIRRDFRQPWINITSREPEIEIKGPIVATTTEMLLATPQGIRQGSQKLWWRKDSRGQLRIVGSDFKPAQLGLEANYLEQVSGDIAATIEDWRKAWESGDIDSYMAFYSGSATQQGRPAGSIRKQKEQLWSRAKPAQVRLSGLRVFLDGAGARADMTQLYADSAGHGDKGVKTLFLRYDGKNWLIQREDWANLAPAQAGQI